MKFSTVKRHFRESIKSLGRNSWMTIASVSAVTVTLILVGVFALIMMNLNKVATDLENDVEIKVLIDETADEAAEKALIEKVKKLPGVSEMTYSTKEDELTKLVKDFGDDFKLFEQSNPLRNVIYVKAADPQQTAKVAKTIDKYEYTYDVMYGEGKVEKLFNFLNISRNVGIVLILGLLFTAIFLISNTIRITIIARRDEIEIMKLVGATNSFVRIPFLLEGMWLGILGSIIPIAVVTTLYHNIYKIIAPRLQGELVQLLDFSPLVYQVSGLLLLIGVLIGIWGSFMSVRKFLKI
ncbi:ABC transporter permease [Lysinibacillus sp. HST-98]|nr:MULTISPECIES: permease-like cell division protein FtsX [Lysinibacillus]EFI69138.1 cell division protein ftsX-like protein [Lysinibacillus fusiformis ZC1]EKU40865.1 cell division protein ftsX-like protein [Lysinibacillus fusiformis ZB2]AUS85428.1 ABC transporter permease [Lysinibacillus sp. YS11]KMN40503.1 cell division protein FtsX [Lysinibacillus sp. LK3]MBL3730171.1 ABC transporter permease [Lysinibacillus sp. HST-98]